MIFTFKKISTGVCLLLLCVVASPQPAHSQEAVSYTVSPTIFDMTANPGQVFRSTVRIINTNKFELHVYVDLNNFTPKGEDGVPVFETIKKSTDGQTSFAEWIDTEHELVIGAEQTVELPLTITVPESASPGGHFAAIMISTKPPASESDKTQVQTAQTISSLFFMRVTGDVKEDGAIRSFRTSSYFLSKPEATFEIRIENKGNVHVQPQGEIRIYNMWGQERGTIPVNQQTLFGNVLPHSVRKFAFTWSSEWSVSDIGRYTAVATLAYGVDTRQFMTADTAFWIIPWKFLLLAISIVGGFIALVSWAIKLYVRRMLALAGVSPGSIQRQIAEAVAEVPAKSKRGKKAVEEVKEKTRRVTAPLEAGILDLRLRLKRSSNLMARFETTINFVRQYWKFFVVLLAILIFTTLVVWFFRSAYAPGRAYQVTTKGAGGDITIANTANPQEASQKPQNDPVGAAPGAQTISIINRSGDESLTESVTKKLSEKNFSVASTTTDFGSLDVKTVIVYSPVDANRALEISKLLNNALLSAYSEGSTNKGILIYIGKDAATVK